MPQDGFGLPPPETLRARTTLPHLSLMPDGIVRRVDSSRRESSTVPEVTASRDHLIPLSPEGGSDPEVVRQRLGHHNAAFFLTKYVKAMLRARRKDAGIMYGLAAQIVEPTALAGASSGHQR